MGKKFQDTVKVGDSIEFYITEKEKKYNGDYDFVSAMNKHLIKEFEEEYFAISSAWVNEKGGIVGYIFAHYSTPYYSKKFVRQYPMRIVFHGENEGLHPHSINLVPGKVELRRLD